MSDFWINVVPESPDYVPSEEASRRAVELFRRFAPAAEKVVAEFTEKVRFIDCGENLERVICPECGQEIEVGWWADRMGEEYEAGYPFKPVALPCCGAQKSVGDLIFDWPQGFARYSVEAMNPDIGDLSDDQLSQFATVLGCKVKKILQHI